MDDIRNAPEALSVRQRRCHQKLVSLKGEVIMAKTLTRWLAEDVEPLHDKSVAWLSQFHFFRDPVRPTYADLSCFFAPADGIILYQREVRPEQPIVNIKGRPYSLRDALCNPGFQHECLVIGVFMTFFDVHVNRLPYPG